jgi:hypothetical protein
VKTSNFRLSWRAGLCQAVYNDLRFFHFCESHSKTSAPIQKLIATSNGYSVPREKVTYRLRCRRVRSPRLRNRAESERRIRIHEDHQIDAVAFGHLVRQSFPTPEDAPTGKCLPGSTEEPGSFREPSRSAHSSPIIQLNSLSSLNSDRKQLSFIRFRIKS